VLAVLVLLLGGLDVPVLGEEAELAAEAPAVEGDVVAGLDAGAGV